MFAYKNRVKLSHLVVLAGLILLGTAVLLIDPGSRESGSIHAAPRKKSDSKLLIHPLIPPVHISGSFAEYRSRGRYHYGVDYKTFNRVGLRVRMPRNGYVEALNISPRGYGNALFMRSYGSNFTFAHLQDFQGKSSGLEYLRRALNLLMPRDSAYLFLPRWFYFKKGDALARSGESGSGAPHLHFEVRTRNIYYNALSLRGMSINDRTAPRILTIYWENEGRMHSVPCRASGEAVHYPKKDAGAAGDAGRRIRLCAPNFPGGVLRISRDARLRLYAGAYDTMAAQNRNGVHEMELRVNGKLVFRKELNKTPAHRLSSADETYDAARTVIGREYVYLLFRAGRRSSLKHGILSWKGVRRAGLLKKSAAEPEARVSILIRDVSGNEARTEFPVRFVAETAGGPTASRKAGKNDASRNFQVVKPGGKTELKQTSGSAEFLLRFSGRSLHLPGRFRLEALRTLPREKSSGTKGSKATPDFTREGPAFFLHARDLYYREGAQAEANFPHSGKQGIALYYFNRALKKWLVLAFPRRVSKGRAQYRFRFRVSGAVAQLLDRRAPRIGRPFLWSPPSPGELKGGSIVREYRISDRGTGVRHSRLRVLLDGLPFPYAWIADRSMLRVTVPGKMVGKRGFLLSLRAEDFAGNRSPWFFDSLER